MTVLSSAHRPRSLNHLLAALPNDTFDRVAPTLSVVPLVLRMVLHQPSSLIGEVYFPGGGFCSVVAVLGDGKMVEVATIGREGGVGMVGAISGEPSPSMTMVQGETDTCYRMSAAAFRAEMDHRDAFSVLMTRYTQAYMGAIMQSTACNAIYSVEERLARWLLMAHDRVGRDQFPLTQEFVAMMLGASRPTVTLVAGTLQKAGLITYHRGQLSIVDRERLESASCECYRTTTDLLRKVTAPAATRGQSESS